MIAAVFRGVQNRMVSGYLLRDVVNKVNGIHFTSSAETHTLGALYEAMLREMRDAAGDSGEFYTPRPVVRFMVAVTDPHWAKRCWTRAGRVGSWWRYFSTCFHKPGPLSNAACCRTGPFLAARPNPCRSSCAR